jgi:branched-subunit amino acid ABC-type transport system permease component
METKSALTSVTIWGAIISILATVSKTAGFDIGDTNGLAETVVAILGGVMSIYGRIRATKRIG